MEINCGRSWDWRVGIKISRKLEWIRYVGKIGWKLEWISIKEEVGIGIQWMLNIIKRVSKLGVRVIGKIELWIDVFWEQLYWRRISKILKFSTMIQWIKMLNGDEDDIL